MARLFSKNILKIKKEVEKMDELEKTIKEKMDKLAEELVNKKWPRMGGLITQKSHCCGASVVLVGTGILSYVCSKCGKPYREAVYG